MHGGWSAVLWTMVPHYMRLFLIHSRNSEFSKCKCISRYTAAAVEFYMMRANLYKFLVSVLSYLIQKLSVVYTSCSGRR